MALSFIVQTVQNSANSQWTPSNLGSDWKSMRRWLAFQTAPTCGHMWHYKRNVPNKTPGIDRPLTCVIIINDNICHTHLTATSLGAHVYLHVNVNI